MTALETVYYDEGIKEIGVIADTHIPTRAHLLPASLFRYFEQVQLILHAGDLVDEEVIDQLKTLAPVEAVAGNMDPLPLHSSLGRLKLIWIGPIAIGLLHGDLGRREVNYEQFGPLFKPVKPGAIIFGHLHQPLVEMFEETLFLNPGSPVDPRRGSQRSCGRLQVNGLRVSGEILYL